MNDLTATLSIAASGMEAQGSRLRHVSENIANADTPNFRPSDLAPPKFDAAVPVARGVGLQRTDSAHFATLGGAAGTFPLASRSAMETRPGGNAVSLEDEMLKVAQNQMDYQAAATLYAKSLGLVKSALGKR